MIANLTFVRRDYQSPVTVEALCRIHHRTAHLTFRIQSKFYCKKQQQQLIRSESSSYISGCGHYFIHYCSCYQYRYLHTAVWLQTTILRSLHAYPNTWKMISTSWKTEITETSSFLTEIISHQSGGSSYHFQGATIGSSPRKYKGGWWRRMELDVCVCKGGCWTGRNTRVMAD